MIMEKHAIIVQYTLYYLIAFLITIDISSAYFYFHWYLERNSTNINTIIITSVNTETVIY